MINFEFQNKTKIVFGRGAEEQVGNLTSLAGKKVLLHYGVSSIKRIGLYDKVIQSLKAAKVDFIELDGVVANPRVALVREGIELCRTEKVDFILAVGGGSVIDSAKGIAIGYYYQGDVWDLYMKLGTAETCLPVGVVLTIPAAGSETSGGSVLSNEENSLKRDVGHPDLRPIFAIMNPEWTCYLPVYQMGCGASDILAHVMERYFTNTKHVAFVDRLAEATMKTIVKETPKLMTDPKNYDIRAEVMWAGTIAHNDLLGTGRQADWASHGMEHELSAIYDIAHGAGLSIIFPAWMKYVYKQDVARFAQYANRIFDIEINPLNLEETALEGIQAVEKFYQEVGMPIRLSEVGIDATRFKEMAQKAVMFGSIGSFVSLDQEDIEKIYQLAK